MGLCKCPKKKVTNLFCYEHRVNVCQNCMVKHHSKCIVQSYLQWLQDSDYNPNCVICEEKLLSQECIRLVCLHVYHWKCLDKKYRQLPSTTAPAGYKCIQCDEALFPLSNLATPVADHLRDKLATVNWGRLPLGLPAVTVEENPGNESDYINNVLSSQMSCNLKSDRKEKDDLVLYLDEPVYSRPEESAKMPRRILSTLTNTKMLFMEEDEKKDRRKLSWITSFSRWIRCIGSPIRHLGRERHGRCKMIIVCLITIAILCSIFSILGNQVTSDDPSFDPVNNPHVHLKGASS